MHFFCVVACFKHLVHIYFHTNQHILFSENRIAPCCWIIYCKSQVKERKQSSAYVGSLHFPGLLFSKCNRSRCLRDTVVPPGVVGCWHFDPGCWLATPSFSLSRRSPCVFNQTIQVQAVKRPWAACGALSVCFAMIISSPNSLYVLHYPYHCGSRTAVLFWSDMLSSSLPRQSVGTLWRDAHSGMLEIGDTHCVCSKICPWTLHCVKRPYSRNSRTPGKC